MGACTSNSSGPKGPGSKGEMRKKGKGTGNIDVMVLLLGAGSVGKSTLCKQILLLEGVGFSQAQRSAFIPVMQKNAINAMQTLCAQSEALGISGCEVTESNRALRDKFMFMKENDERLDPNLAQEIQTLWRDPGIQTTYSHRSAYALSDGAGYFLEKVKMLCSPAEVTDNDMLKCNARTTGIVETEVQLESTQKFLLIDVGGQRLERRKWMHLLGKSKLVVFVADSSAFDQGLIEDPSTNRLTEELNLFGGICSMCPSRPIVLVLNKVDVLKEKLDHHAVKPVHVFHPTCPANTSGVEDVLSWMTSEFLARNTNKDSTITVVATNAVDSYSAKAVVEKVKGTLAQNFG